MFRIVDDRQRRIFCNLLLITVVGCGSGAPVRVLEEGRTMVTASVGGPIVPSSSPIGFIPYVTVGAANGVTEDLTIHGNVHVLMSAFAVLGVDAGASYRVLKGQGAVPEITAGGRLIFFTDFFAWNTLRLYPDLHVNASWEIAERTLLYAGTHATFQWSPSQVFLSPMVGLVLPVSSAVHLQGELIWQAANIDTRYGIFEGQSSVGGTGSIGGFIGLGVEL